MGRKVKSKKTVGKNVKCIVKRKGHEENYDEKKVYASVYSACMICEYPEKRCEKTASNITKKINKWFEKESKKKKCVNSRDIRKEVIGVLKKIDKDAEIIYKHHFDLS